MGRIAVFFRGMKRNRDLTLKLEQLQKEAEANPGNPLSRIRLGDTLLKLNRTKEAMDIYEQAARDFIEKKFFPQAIAVSKIILRHDPRRDRNLEKAIGRLYEKMFDYKERTLHT